MGILEDKEDNSLLDKMVTRIIIQDGTYAYNTRNFIRGMQTYVEKNKEDDKSFPLVKKYASWICKGNEYEYYFVSQHAAKDAQEFIIDLTLQEFSSQKNKLMSLETYKKTFKSVQYYPRESKPL